jgi:phosphinothricin acetyltransferase
MRTKMRVRLATPADAASIARIYNEGILERTATLETTLRSAEDVLAWFDGVHPITVVEDDAGGVVAFARTYEYRPRECYRGVFEFAMYTEGEHRRKGAGTMAMRELVTQARAAGAWKLVSGVFVENAASRALLGSLGFREVGVHYRHGKLDGRWRDVVVVEKFLAPIGAEGSIGPPIGRPAREQILERLRTSTAQERAQTLGWARSQVEVYRRPDRELLDAAADAFFASRHDAATRALFVELFRSYAALSREAARDVARAIFERLEKRSLGGEIDAFYEAAFVVKQVFGVTSSSAAPALAGQLPRLLGWMKQAIELPPAMRGRISPGNVVSLLITLALSSSSSEDERNHVADLAASAKARHRVEPPATIRPPAGSSPPSEEIIDLTHASDIEIAPIEPSRSSVEITHLDSQDIIEVPPSALSLEGEGREPAPPAAPILPPPKPPAESKPAKKKKGGAKRPKRARPKG